jgi:hypothetical protein
MADLVFTEWRVNSDASLAWPFATLADRCGIYWLEFTNGESYIGQSIGVVSRLSSHRRRWNDIRLVRFVDCPRAELDQRERDVIRLADSNIDGMLRNKNFTKQPQGLKPVSVEIVAAESVLLPWSRSERRTATPEDIALNSVPASDSQENKARQLSELPSYGQLIELLGLIISEAIPDPVRSQRTLWTLSALPSTSRVAGTRRLATINCGILELAWISEQADTDGTNVSVVLNLDASVDDELLEASLIAVGIDTENGSVVIEESSYKSDSEVVHLHFEDVADALSAMASSLVKDSMYSLAVRSMRRGKNPQRRYHNTCVSAWQ